MTARTFESGPARRERTLIAVGIIGPSGSGKTKSALRLVDGMARVGGGATWLIDTNNRRSLHHAPQRGESHQPGVNHVFDVLHMPPPYSPADFGAAFKHCIGAGARRIIVDSFSDEHEGEGGVLDMHDAELDRRAGKTDYAARDRMNSAAWIPVKREHNKLKLWMFQQPVDWIITFRAKEKSKPAKGKGIEDLGWQPLGAEDILFELLLKCLLPPQADGKPIWTSDVMAERKWMKLPGWFRTLFATNPVLDESIGEQLARWAAGADVVAAAAAPPSASVTVTTSPAPSIADRLDAARDGAELAAVEADIPAAWAKLRQPERDAINAAGKRAHARVKAAAAAAAFRSDGGAGAASAGGTDPPIDNDEATEIAAIEAEEARRQLLEQEHGGEHG